MRRVLVPMVVVVVAALLGSMGVVLVVGSDDTASATVTLEPINSTGADPFTESVAINETADFPDSVHAVTSGLQADSATGGLTASGSTPGLYGGTQDEAVCDPDQLVTYLEQNPDKAAAWAAVLGIRPANIETYVAKLTPVVLTTDTRVTNHGYKNGKATSLQSVLQAGTAVLVDARGVPRVKCGCGNPLTEPTTISNATPVGDPWDGYELAKTATIIPAPRPVPNLTVVNVQTGDTYQQPTSKSGGGSGTDAIHDVDLLNRTYRTHQPEASDEDGAVCSFDEVTLVNGKSGGASPYSEATTAEVTYADVTGDGNDEALVALRYSSGGSLWYANHVIFGIVDGEAEELACVPGDVATVTDDSRGVVGWYAQSNGSVGRADATSYRKVTYGYRNGRFVLQSNEIVPTAEFEAVTASRSSGGSAPCTEAALLVAVPKLTATRKVTGSKCAFGFARLSLKVPGASIADYLLEDVGGRWALRDGGASGFCAGDGTGLDQAQYDVLGLSC